MKNMLLLAILLLAGTLRFFTLSKLMVFTPDEEYQFYIVQTLIKDFHIIWIGLSALGFDVYLGPFWLYIMYPFAAIFQGNPLTGGALTSVLGVGTVFLIYLLGKEMFGPKVGLLASLLYASSALMIFYDQQGYPPSVPFWSALMVLSLYLTKKSPYWWIVFAATFGMTFHIHFSLSLMILVAIYWAFAHRETLNKKIVLLSVFTFTVMMSPLIAFDYFHKGSNITAPLRMLKSAGENQYNLNLPQRLDNFATTLSRVWYLQPGLQSSDEILYPCLIHPLAQTTQRNWLLAGFSLVLLTVFIVFIREKLLILSALPMLIPFLLLSAISPIEYYLLGFFPILFLIFASSIESLPRSFKYGAYILVILLASSGVFTVLAARGDFGLDAKKTLVKKVMAEVKEESFSLQEEGGCQKYGGFRYVFAVYGRRPDQSSEDFNFAWLYPDEISQKPTKYSVIIKELRPPFPEGYTADIFKN